MTCEVSTALSSTVMQVSKIKQMPTTLTQINMKAIESIDLLRKTFKQSQILNAIYPEYLFYTLSWKYVNVRTIENTLISAATASSSSSTSSTSSSNVKQSDAVLFCDVLLLPIRAIKNTPPSEKTKSQEIVFNFKNKSASEIMKVKDRKYLKV